jgi:hypothetical protein
MTMEIAIALSIYMYIDPNAQSSESMFDTRSTYVNTHVRFVAIHCPRSHGEPCEWATRARADGAHQSAPPPASNSAYSGRGSCTTDPSQVPEGWRRKAGRSSSAE